MALGLRLPALTGALPARCEVCRAWPARPVCDGCLARLTAPVQRCRLCALLLPAGQEVCGHCLRQPPVWTACHAAVTWGHPWAGLVARFKFGGEPGWARTFATLLRQSPAVRSELAQADWLVPMPLAPRRLAERGFNQAHELARRLTPGRTRSDLVQRVRTTAPQAGLNHDRRLANLHGAFGPGPGIAAVRGASVVLVDDVMTTGASLGAAAAVLQSAGAARIACIVLARTEDHASPGP